MKLKLSKNVIVNGLLAIGLLIILIFIVLRNPSGTTEQQKTIAEQSVEKSVEVQKDRLQVESTQTLAIFGQSYKITIVRDWVSGRLYMFLQNGDVVQIIPMFN